MASIRTAAAIMLTRSGKVWLAQRGQSRFLPGFSVFPGGVSEPDETFAETALRELREETGLALRANEINLQPFARAITPAYSKYRFDVRVFHLELDARLEPHPVEPELVNARWLSFREAIELRNMGEIQLAPPTFRQLQLWDGGSWDEQKAFDDPPESLQTELPFCKGLSLVPVRVESMPPAQWTNCAILGEEDFYIVDPGGPDLQSVLAVVENKQKRGDRLRGVILSHHHPDHISGYPELKGLELPIFCHQLTAERLGPEFPMPTSLKDGQELQLGNDLSARFHFTPGHAPGHLAIEIPQSRTLLAGDMISSLSSIVIPRDGGCLKSYLASLKRLSELDCRLVVPAHGPPFGSGSLPFRLAHRHRLSREEQVLKAVDNGHLEIGSITNEIYGPLDPPLDRAAEENVWQMLGKLEEEKAVRRTSKGWFLTRRT